MTMASEQAILISIDIDTSGRKESLMKNKLERVDKSSTFESLLLIHMESPNLNDNVKVYVSNSLSRKDEVEVDIQESLLFVSQLLEPKSIYFHVTRAVETIEEVPECTFKRDAFKLMMAPPDRRLEKMPGTDQKVKLHNDLLTDIQGDRTLLSGRVGAK